MQDAKHILASKTFWVHILTLVLAIAATCQGDEWIAQHPEWMQFLVYFSAFMGIVLRMLTTQPVKVKPDGPSDNKPTRILGLLMLGAALFAPALAQACPCGGGCPCSAGTCANCGSPSCPANQGYTALAVAASIGGFIGGAISFSCTRTISRKAAISAGLVVFISASSVSSQSFAQRPGDPFYIANPPVYDGRDFQAHDALDEVNAARRSWGLRPFVRDRGLTLGALHFVKWRADRLQRDHTPCDFTALPPGTCADLSGCGAPTPLFGWFCCCTEDNARYAGAAWCWGSDGRRYQQIFLRR